MQLRLHFTIGVLLTGLLLTATDTRNEENGVWLDVPFVRQSKNLCGPACISMVLQYWDGQVKTSGNMARSTSRYDPVAIAAKLGTTEEGGSLGSQMKRYFLAHGYDAFIFQPEWSDLKHHLIKGRPLITALDNRGDLDHFVVLAGWNARQDVVLVNDPAQRKLLKLGRAEFQKSWERSSRWTLLALPRVSSQNALSAPDAR